MKNIELEPSHAIPDLTPCTSPLTRRRNLSNRQLAPACKALGLEAIGWHSLRHSMRCCSIRWARRQVPHRAGATRALIARGYARAVLAFAVSWGTRSRSEGGTITRWTQKDPNSGNQDLGSSLIQTACKPEAGQPWLQRDRAISDDRFVAPSSLHKSQSMRHCVGKHVGVQHDDDSDNGS
jgi:hypothetical protein